MSINFNTNAPPPVQSQRWGSDRRWSDDDVLSTVEMLRAHGYVAFASDSRQRAEADAQSLKRAVLLSPYWPPINGARFPRFISGVAREIDGWWHAYLLVKSSFSNNGLECDQDGNLLRKQSNEKTGSKA